MKINSEIEEMLKMANDNPSLFTVGQLALINGYQQMKGNPTQDSDEIVLEYSSWRNIFQKNFNSNLQKFNLSEILFWENELNGLYNALEVFGIDSFILLSRQRMHNEKMKSASFSLIGHSGIKITLP